MSSEEFRGERPCSPVVMEHAVRMGEIMRQPEHNHAGVPGLFVIELWKAGYIGSPADFEACLRKVGSRVHLIAVPKDHFGEQLTAVYPEGVPGEPEYALYACVNGAQEAAEKLARLGISAEDNTAMLARTGVLTPVSS